MLGRLLAGGLAVLALLAPGSAFAARMQDREIRVPETAASVDVTILALPGASVRWRASDVTASGGFGGTAPDFSPVGGTLTFGPAQTSAVVTVPLVDDRVSDPFEEFDVILLEATGDTISDPMATRVFIDDDDPRPGRCANTRFGTMGPDILRGGPAGDRLVSWYGDDILIGGAGDDCAGGGRGDDRIGLGPGNDLANGGPGADRIAGGAGNDRIIGGPGRDDLRGGPGDDRITGPEGGPDRVDCGPGHDTAVVDRRDVVVGCEVVIRR